MSISVFVCASRVLSNQNNILYDTYTCDGNEKYVQYTMNMQLRYNSSN